MKSESLPLVVPPPLVLWHESDADPLIVIGVDVHKQSLTAAAVDEVGRAVAEYNAKARFRSLRK